MIELIQIDSGYFCAGVVLKNNVAARSAPILKYMVKQSWSRGKVIGYANLKGWKWLSLGQTT